MDVLEQMFGWWTKSINCPLVTIINNSMKYFQLLHLSMIVTTLSSAPMTLDKSSTSTSTLTTTDTPTDTFCPLVIIQLGCQDDSKSTSTNTGDALLHPHGQLCHSIQTSLPAQLCLAILKCFAAAQAEYICVYNAKAIKANLCKIAALQCTEECTKAMVTILQTEDTLTLCTDGVTINKHICKNQKDPEKQIQSLKQNLAHEKSKTTLFKHNLS
jgi:hypothetical protein